MSSSSSASECRICFELRNDFVKCSQCVNSVCAPCYSVLEGRGFAKCPFCRQTLREEPLEFVQIEIDDEDWNSFDLSVFQAIHSPIHLNANASTPLLPRPRPAVETRGRPDLSQPRSPARSFWSRRHNMQSPMQSRLALPTLR
jgi:hypothetical protein